MSGGFGIYVHWPFCTSLCPYCDFNSHVAGKIDALRWKSAYLSELRRSAAELGRRKVDSIYFGGGTPSLMSPDVVGSILDGIKRLFRVAADCEITLEANPGSSDAGKFRAFADAGVNRFSIGMQSLRDVDLRRLGRRHNAAQARKAFETAIGIVDNVSLDLIYARQFQTRDQWRRELLEAIAMQPPHMSLYQLTIESATPFGRLSRSGKLRGMPDEDLAAGMFLDTHDICLSHDYDPYEVSNFARGNSASRHNLVYWRCGDYLGIGPGAHGRLTTAGIRLATEATSLPTAWLKAVETSGNGDLTRCELTLFEQNLEYLLMSLRLAEGLDRSRLLPARPTVPLEAGIAEMREAGMIITCANTIRVTEQGKLLLNAVIDKLIPS